MSQTITAIYENGALWPIAPLDLPEQSQVEIEVKQITAPEAEELDERSRIHQALVEALRNNPPIWQPEFSCPKFSCLCFANRKMPDRKMSLSSGRMTSEVVH